jgi:hypothetical protein
VDDFDGAVFNPPIDSFRQPIPELTQYTQVVSVWPVFLNNLRSNSDESNPDLPKTSYQGAVRVRVRILHQSAGAPTEVYRTSWIRLDN